MKKSRFLKLLVISLVLFGLAFSGCSHEIDPDTVAAVQDRRIDGADFPNEGMSRHEYLAAQKALEHHKVSVDELTKIVSEAFIQTVGSYTPEAGTVAMVYKKVPVADHVRFRNFTQRDITRPPRSAAQAADAEAVAVPEIPEVVETSPVEVYDFAIDGGENPGMWHVMASNDARVGHILAITEGSLEDADNDFTGMYKEFLQDYIDATIVEYNDITIDEVTKIAAGDAAGAPVAEFPAGARSTVITGPYDNNPNNWKLDSTRTDLTIQKQPLIKTKWGQGIKGHDLGAIPSDTAYNNYFKYEYRNHADVKTFVTGCGATAVAQIVAYYGQITYWSGRVPKAYNTNSSNQIPGLGVWNGKAYNFALLTQYPRIYNNSPDEVKGQIAALMYNISRQLGSTVKKDKTTSSTNSYAPTFVNFGYSVNPYPHTIATGLSTSSTGFNIKYHVGLNNIKTMLNNNKPFLIRGENTKNEGHVWIIDGYGSATYLEEYYSKGGQRVTRRINLKDTFMVHCNLGWDGEDNGYNNSSGWYLYGVFDTARNWNHLSNSDMKKGDYNYTTGTKVIFPHWR